MTGIVWKIMGKTLVVTLSSMVGVVSLLFLWSVIGSLMGFVTGWILSKIFLGDAITEGILELFGKQISTNALPQIGAFLGFISGFFRQTVRVKAEGK
jgi:hypothetical protein